MTAEIITERTLDELSRAAAGLVIQIAEEAIEKRDAFSVSLAGGSTPRSLYSLLASEEYRTAIDWSKVTFFFGDERNVPPDSPESNYRMVHETLFGPLKIDPHRIHRWRTELSNAEAIAEEYEIHLRGSVNGPAPRLDLIALGVGADGHTASLFPHTAALHENERLTTANWVEKLNDYRLTMTFPLINNAANVIFLVAGKEKAEAVAAILEGKYDPEEYPAQNVRPAEGNAYWFIDEPAAALLNTG